MRTEWVGLKNLRAKIKPAIVGGLSAAEPERDVEQQFHGAIQPGFDRHELDHAANLFQPADESVSVP